MHRPIAFLLLGFAFAAAALAAPNPAQPADTAAINDALQLYSARLLQVAHKARSYPEEAVAGRFEGTAEVRVTVTADGTLKHRRLTRSSGHAVLDTHALAMVEKAVPLTPIPSELKGRPFSVMVTFVFAFATLNRV